VSHFLQNIDLSRNSLHVALVLNAVFLKDLDRNFLTRDGMRPDAHLTKSSRPQGASDNVVANGSIFGILGDLGRRLAPSCCASFLQVTHAMLGAPSRRRCVPIARSSLRCFVVTEAAIVVGHAEGVVSGDRGGSGWCPGTIGGRSGVACEETHVFAMRSLGIIGALSRISSLTYADRCGNVAPRVVLVRCVRCGARLRHGQAVAVAVFGGETVSVFAGSSAGTRC